MKKVYPSILKLKSYQVLPDFDEIGTSKIFDVDVSSPLTYGKTVFFITYKIKKGNTDIFLRPGSEIKCEILDSRGKNIYTDFIPSKNTKKFPPYILEVNSSPGTEGIEEANNKNIVKVILEKFKNLNYPTFYKKYLN